MFPQRPTLGNLFQLGSTLSFSRSNWASPPFLPAGQVHIPTLSISLERLNVKSNLYILGLKPQGFRQG